MKGRGLSDFVTGIALRTSGGTITNLKRFSEDIGFSLPNDNHFQNGAFDVPLLRTIINNHADAVREENLKQALNKYVYVFSSNIYIFPYFIIP